ncbi:MAG: GAF domain-containing protein [Anaerolineales bacterium]|nr:GAF domain-containing protein [Anaerolineales bacterium]
MTQLAELHDRLKWKSREVDVLLALDRIRDSAQSERELVAELLNTLTDAAEAELGLLWLTDEDTPGDDLVLRGVVDRAQLFTGEAPAALAALARQAAAQPTAAFLKADLQLGERRLTYALAMPLRVGEEQLGVLLLLSTDRPFDRPEQDLIQKAAGQIDSALRHARLVRDLQRRTRELETIFRIDRVRDTQTDFQAMLNTVLAEICSSLEAEAGFIMLYDAAGRELELRALTDDSLLLADEAARALRQTALDCLASAHIEHRTFTSGAVRAVAAAPLMLRNELTGVLGIVNRRERAAFTLSDVQMLHAITSQMDTAIFESLQTQRLRNAFGKCVGPQVMNRLLTTDDADLLSSERFPITTLFSDIRGFTDMAKRLAPETLQAVLNDHLSALSDLVLRYEGTLDKYIGDCVMCFFNAPERQADHALRAVRLALDMQRAHRTVMERWRDRLALPPIGIGISTGETLVGNFGSVRRLEYTVIGYDVNLAARLCSTAEAGQTLISQSTYDLVRDFVVAEALPPMTLKGIIGEVRCWNVTALK